MHTLTSPQQNIWNLQKYYEGTTISAICGAIYFKDELDIEILKKAINHGIEHQSGLRLRFCEVNGKAMQRMTEYQYEEISVLQFSDKEALRQYVLQCAQKLTSLTDIPLYHFAIFQLNGQTGIVTALSHLISDAWTLSLLAKQIADAYWELAQGEPCDNKTWDYLDHLYAEEEYLASSRYEKDTCYWQEKYPDKPEPSTIKLCTATPTTITAKRITSTLGSELTEHIGQFCKETSITPAVLFETAVILYLARINPENRTVTIGTPVLGRHNAREKNTAGMFISTMPLTILVSASDTVEVLANRITDSHRELFRHQRYPYTSILRQLREKHDFTGNLYDVMVSYQNAQTGVDAETEWFSNGYSETPFVLHIDNRDNGSSYTWTVDYQTEVFRQEAEIQLIINRLEHILQQILTNYKILVGEISIIPDAEYRQMIFDFNDTVAEYPKDKCIHELFCEQASRTPDSSALIFEEHVFTYRQLDEMSNSLAHALREMGVGRNDVVPIIARRSWHIVVAMLGIFKAGGAYMPVDPDYPGDRIAYMLSEVGPKVVLNYGCNLEIAERAIDLCNFDFYSNVAPINSINDITDSFGIIFTSGSTGQPKGSILCHQGAVNFAFANDALYTECNCVIATAIITFDAFFLDTICPIIRGITCVLADLKEQFEGNSFSALMQNHVNANVFITPTKFRRLLDGCVDKSFLQNFNHICVGGEVFSNLV